MKAENNFAGLELGIVVVIIGVTVSLLLPQLGVVSSKARLSEALIGAAGRRVDFVVDAALTGNYFAASSVTVAAAGSQRDIEKAIGMAEDSGSASEARAHLQGGPRVRGRGDPGARSEGGDGRYRYEVLEGQLVVSGEELGEAFQLPFAMAVPVQGAPTTVLWVCGEAQVPPSWLVVRRHETKMPRELLSHRCRGGETT